MHPEDALLDVSIGLRLLQGSPYDLLEDELARQRIEEVLWLAERIGERFHEGLREYDASRRVSHEH